MNRAKTVTETSSTESFNESYARESARIDVHHVIRKYFIDNQTNVFNAIMAGDVINTRSEIISMIDKLIEKAKLWYDINLTEKNAKEYWRVYLNEVYSLTNREISDYLK
jgi:hypothetical protein